MARVPTYDGPQVREAPLRGGQMDMGAAVQGTRAVQNFGATFQQLGEMGANVATKEQQRLDQEAAFSLEAQVMSEWGEFEAKLRESRRGRNAHSYDQEVQQWWAEAAQKHGQNLSPRARELVNKSLTRSMMNAVQGARDYKSQQLRIAADAAYKSANTMSIQRAVSTGTEKAAQEAIAEMAERRKHRAATEGWTPEQVQADELAHEAAIHGSLVRKMMDDEPEKAQDYYNRHKSKIDADTQAALEKGLNEAVEDRKALQTASAMADKPLDEQLAEAAKIEDPSLREKTLQHVKQNFALKEQAQAAKERELSDKAWQHVAEGRMPPASILAEMDGSERNQIHEFFRQKAEHEVDRAWTLKQRREQEIDRAEARRDRADARARAQRAEARAIESAKRAAQADKANVKTDPAVLAELLDLANGDEAAFKKLRLAQYAYKLSPTDLKYIQRMQDELNGEPGATGYDDGSGRKSAGGSKGGTKKAGSGSGKLHSSPFTFNQKIDGHLDLLGARGDKELKGIFKAAAIKDYEAFLRVNDRPPSDEEEMKILDDLTIKGKKASWWQKGPLAPDDASEAGSLAEARLTGKKFVPQDIPPGERALIEQALRDAGAPVTEEAVLRMFKKSKGVN